MFDGGNWYVEVRGMVLVVNFRTPAVDCKMLQVPTALVLYSSDQEVKSAGRKHILGRGTWG